MLLLGAIIILMQYDMFAPGFFFFSFLFFFWKLATAIVSNPLMGYASLGGGEGAMVILLYRTLKCDK